jgi:hypothetical protein
MPARKSPLNSVRDKVLVASRRRCCLCVFLEGRDETRKGQIAHLNRNRTDSRFENLVFLCLDHHSDYDGKNYQSKGYQPGELRDFGIVYTKDILTKQRTSLTSRKLGLHQKAWVQKIILVFRESHNFSRNHGDTLFGK